MIGRSGAGAWRCAPAERMARPAMSESEINAVVREVTDEEVVFYREHGWVMLRQLVDPAFATELLEAGLAHREATDGHTELMTRKAKLEPYHSFMFSERMDRNATRLMERNRLKGIDVPLRYRYDNLVLKPPGGAGTSYHQDAAEHGSDRGGELQVSLPRACCHL
eukprot:COSAG06_NODE_330_length_17413_cov_12.112510_2_plen_165_part_00